MSSYRRFIFIVPLEELLALSTFYVKPFCLAYMCGINSCEEHFYIIGVDPGKNLPCLHDKSIGKHG